MAKLTEEDVHDNYKRQSLKLLVKFDNPTIDQVWNHLCLRYNCPVEHCNFLLGFKQGKQCDHVLKVKQITSDIADFIKKY